MEDLIATSQALLDYITDQNVCDTADDDGDGYIAYSQSHTLKSLVSNLQQAIKEATPTRDAVKLIKKCFLTAIRQQRQQP
jgi:hypothetical protein